MRDSLHEGVRLIAIFLHHPHPHTQLLSRGAGPFFAEECSNIRLAPKLHFGEARPKKIVLELPTHTHKIRCGGCHKKKQPIFYVRQSDSATHYHLCNSCVKRRPDETFVANQFDDPEKLNDPENVIPRERTRKSLYDLNVSFALA